MAERHKPPLTLSPAPEDSSLEDELLARLDRVLRKFGAEGVGSIEDRFVYWPSPAHSKLGAGSYGETYRMREVGSDGVPIPTRPACAVKVIPKTRVTHKTHQLEHMCAELAVTGFVDHPHINRRLGLLHTTTDLMIVLELCEGTPLDPLGRLLIMMGRYRPALIPEAAGLVSGWRNEFVARQAKNASRPGTPTSPHQTTPPGSRRNSGSDPANDTESFLEYKLNQYYMRSIGTNKEPSTGQDLFACLKYYKHLPERKARIIIRQVLIGLEHLHLHGIVHRDIKAENIVVAETREVLPLYDPSGKIVGIRVRERIHARIVDYGLVKFLHIKQLPMTPSPSLFAKTAKGVVAMSPHPIVRSALADRRESDGNEFQRPPALNPFGRQTTEESDAFFQTAKDANPFANGKDTTESPLHVTPGGTLAYSAIESIQGMITASRADGGKWCSSKSQLPKLDIYGAGATLYMMCNGRLPFRVKESSYRKVNRREMAKRYMAQIEAGLSFEHTCSPEASEMIQRMMATDPAARPTAREALMDPFLVGIGDVYSYEVLVDGSVTEIIDTERTDATPTQSGQMTSPSLEASVSPKVVPQADTEAPSPFAVEDEPVDLMEALRLNEDGE